MCWQATMRPRRSSRTTPQARGNLERAIALEPQFAEAHYNLANILRQQGACEQAMVRYERALADFAEAHFNLVNAFRAQGKLDDAVTHYERALALVPEFAAPHCNLGVLLLDFVHCGTSLHL